VINIPSTLPKVGNAGTHLSLMSSDAAHMVCGGLAGRTWMTKFKLFSTAHNAGALAGGMQVAEVIQEPGLYAFYHPNGDLGLGSSRPADAMAQSLRGGEVSGMKMSVRRRHVSHASSIKHY
jgi:hypothetical protein